MNHLPAIMRKVALGLPVGILAALALSDVPAQQYSLVGNWEGATTFNGLPVTSSATLRSNGSFTMEAESGPGLAFNIVGTYTVMPGQQTVRFHNRDWDPREACLPGLDFQLHCTAFAVPRTLDARYRFVSSDIVILEAPSLAVGPVQYRRMR